MTPAPVDLRFQTGGRLAFVAVVAQGLLSLLLREQGTQGAISLPDNVPSTFPALAAVCAVYLALGLFEATPRQLGVFRYLVVQNVLAVAIVPLPGLAPDGRRNRRLRRRRDLRHRLHVVLDYAEDRVRLSVKDDGRGAPTEPGLGFGLLGVRERARLAGGELSIRSAGGFVLDLTFPTEHEAAV